MRIDRSALLSIAALAVSLSAAIPGRAEQSGPPASETPAPGEIVQLPPPKIGDKQRPFAVMVGDPAPQLKISQWLIGEPVEQFESGKVYVIHLWSTICEPCIEYMERFTRLQAEFADKGLVVIGATSLGKQNTRAAIESFVFREGSPIQFTVALDRSRQTIDMLLNPAGRKGLPCVFIIDGEGQIAFIGHPSMVERTVRNILSGQFRMGEARNKYMMSISSTWGYTEFLELLKQKDFPGAYRLAWEIVQTEGWDSYEVLSNVAWTIVDPENPVEQKDLALALRAAERAVELSERKDADALDTLALVHFLREEPERAVEVQREAVSLARTDKFRARLQKKLDEYTAAASK